MKSTEPTIDQAYRAAMAECSETYIYPGITRPLQREEFYKVVLENAEESQKPEILEEQVKNLLSTNSKLLKNNCKLKRELLKIRDQIDNLIEKF